MRTFAHRVVPPVALLPGFVAGLLLAGLPRAPGPVPAAAAAAVLLAIALAGARRIGGAPLVAASTIAAVLCGLAVARGHDARLNVAPFDGSAGQVDGRAVRVVGWARHDAAATRDGFRFEIEATRVEIGGEVFVPEGPSGAARRPFRFRVDVRDPRGARAAPLLGGRGVEAVGTLRRSARPGPGGLAAESVRLARSGLHGRVTVKSRALLFDLGPARGGRVHAGLAALRRRLLRPLRRGWPPAAGPEQTKASARSEARGRLLEAFLLGRVHDLPPEIDEAFRRSGLSHVVAISGLQVLLAAGLASALARAAGLPTPGRRIAALLTVALYALLAGPEPSVRRAAFGAGIHLTLRLAGRKIHPPATLALTALLLLTGSPGMLRNAGFQLSFAATAGLLAIAGRFPDPGAGAPDGRREPLRAAGRWACAALVAGGAAWVVTAPITAAWFGRVSPYAIVGNLVAVPIGTAIVALGGALCLAGVLWAPSGDALVPVLDILLRALVGICAWAPPSAPWVYDVARPGALATAAYSVLLWCAWRSGSARGRSALVSAWLLLGLTALHGPPFERSGKRADEIRLDALDVGQGDALLLRTPSGASILIDGGPAAPGRWDAGERIVAPALRRLGVRRLDAVVATHPHADHIGGLPAVVRAARPSRLLLAAGERSERALTLERAAGRQGASTRRLAAGETIEIGGGARLRVLHPDPVSARSDDANRRSIVLGVSFGETRWFLGADADPATVGALRVGAPAFDLIKVPHHGSDRAGVPEFLAASRPPVAVIPVGRRNPWGHPGRHTLHALAMVGAATFRTDRHGEIAAASDGDLVRAGPRGPSWPLAVRAAFGSRPQDRTR